MYLILVYLKTMIFMLYIYNVISNIDTIFDKTRKLCAVKMSQKMHCNDDFQSILLCATIM